MPLFAATTRRPDPFETPKVLEQVYRTCRLSQTQGEKRFFVINLSEAPFTLHHDARGVRFTVTDSSFPPEEPPFGSTPPPPGFPPSGFPPPGYPQPEFPQSNPGYPNPGYPNPGFSDGGFSGGPPRSGTPPLEFGDVIDRGFRLWWKTLKSVLPWTFAIALPAQIVSIWLARTGPDLKKWSETFQQQSQDNPGAPPDFSGLNQAILHQLPALVLALITTTVIRGMLTAYYTDRILMRNTPISSCMKSVVPRIGALIGVVILVALSGGVGIFLCCVGYFIFLIRFAVAPQACIVERAGPIQSMKRSWHLTQRRFWPMLGLVIVTGLMSLIISVPFTLLSDSIGKSTIGGTKAIVGGTIQVGLTSIGVAMSGALGAAILVFVYLDLRVRFENLDLGVIAAQNTNVTS